MVIEKGLIRTLFQFYLQAAFQLNDVLKLCPRFSHTPKKYLVHSNPIGRETVFQSTS